MLADSESSSYVPSGRKGWIEDVVVDASARGAGVGEALVRAALERAAREGVERVMLTSRPARRAARALYRKVGFEEAETSVFVRRTTGQTGKIAVGAAGNELAEEAGEQAAGLLAEAGRQMEKPKSSASDER